VPVAVSGLSTGFAANSAGGYHTCALTTAGGVLCWGYNAEGQLGGYSNGGPVPVAVTGLSSGVAAISAGIYHTCALTTAGGVLCWGYNGNGQLGDNSTTYSPVPVAVSGLSSGVAAISAGSAHTCALTTGGAAQCWGYNADGQLGNSSATDSHVPVAVSGLSSGATTISAGFYHTCALTTGGAAKCWGYNGFGNLGNNSTSNAGVPVAVSGLSSGVTAISAGLVDTCAVGAPGVPMCWGDDLAVNSPVPVTIPEP
jgi:alpha-tubulin suppressor-like RCC1 family protein